MWHRYCLASLVFLRLLDRQPKVWRLCFILRGPDHHGQHLSGVSASVAYKPQTERPYRWDVRLASDISVTFQQGWPLRAVNEEVV